MKKLKVIRFERRMSQSELAEKSGVNLKMIQKYERGEKNINHARFVTIIKLAKALNCDPVKLLEKETGGKHDK